MTTERLYHANSYVTEFEATVLGHGDGGRVYLDRSAFYPTSGGQQHDLGSLRTIGGEHGPSLELLDVVDEGDRVAHVLGAQAAERLAVGARVTGRIDWARRFDHMQQHSGQHLLSAIFQQALGLGTTSVHFGADASTLDLDAAALDPEQLLAVEQRANAAVFENRAVSTAIEDAPEGLRKLSARGGPLRIVTIDGLDRSACGGTHVTRTGEIGPLLLRKVERVRKATRVEFVCGGRAIRQARRDYEVLSRLGTQLSTAIDEVPEVVAKRLAELERDAKALRVAKEGLANFRANELYAKARAAAGDGIALHIERMVEGSAGDLRGLAQGFAANPRSAFIATLERPASILFATSEDTGLDAGATLKAALVRVGGRGGGSARLAQGTVGTPEALAEVLAAVLAAL